MTVIRPNSITGITSITAQANEINVFRHNGVLAGLQLNGVNHHTSAGVSTFHTVNVLGNLDVAGVLTYQDVTNVDSLGIGTFRTGINVSGGQLDVGSNIKIGNAGVVTATSFVGSLSGGSVSGTSGAFTGNIDLNSDTNKLKIGAGDDFQFFHNGSNNFIETNTGDIRIKTSDSSGNLTFTAGGSTESLRIDSSGQFSLGRTGQITANGNQSTSVFEQLSNNNYPLALHSAQSNNRGLAIFYATTGNGNTGDPFIVCTDNTNNKFLLTSDGTITTRGNILPAVNNDKNLGSSSVRWANIYGGYLSCFVSVASTYQIGEFRNQHSTYGGGVRFKSNNTYGSVEIMRYDGSYGAGLYNSTGGWHWDSNLQTHGSVSPWTDGNLNLGSSSKRWANIYTTDLQLSNKGKTNDVDGTWGDYTIQEGESDLFLINNRSGKKYMFMLKEVV